ncbi:MAG: PEP-CTERM sorting domain-containing protein [Verrucomicrobiia bacterium]
MPHTAIRRARSPDTVGDNHAGTKVGRLSIDSNGQISTTLTAVPEPSTWAMLGLGALAALVSRVRRSRVA